MYGRVKVTNNVPTALQEMLFEHFEGTDQALPDNEFQPDIGQDQLKAFNRMKAGENIVLLGSGGVGKSYLVKIFEKYVKTEGNKQIYLTSTTGISAYSIGGITINSFLGIGTGEYDIEMILRKVKKRKDVQKRILNTDILVIDEISMMSATLFEKINTLLQTVRRNNSFFGGIQTILTGDFLQLLPVFTSFNESVRDDRLLIESSLFTRELKKQIVLLNKNYRQQNDTFGFCDILTRIRNGTHTDKDISILQSRKTVGDHSNKLHLVVSNKKALKINQVRLAELCDESVSYDASYDVSGDTDSKKLLLDEMQRQFSLRGIDKVTLKTNARVMLIKNLSVERGLVNGSTGKVIEITREGPVIEFDNGIVQMIEKMSWDLEVIGGKIKAKQLPLTLAWAITVHKSQSLSLECAVLDVQDCFCDHQVYVALSRLKSLSGLYLDSFDPTKITINKKVIEFLDKVI